MAWGQPWHFAAGAVFGFVSIGPTLWWLKLNSGLDPHNRPATVFYENDATPEEIERFQQQDQIESLAWHMRGKPGFGYVQRDQRHM